MTSNPGRLIHQESYAGHHVRVYYYHQWNEYHCKVWWCGQRAPALDYHTDDRQDAIDTSLRLITEERTA